MRYVVTRMPPDELRHHGIKGQKWGHRHYQNKDGTWTPEGQKRYSTDSDGKYGEPGSERREQKVNKEQRDRHVRVESKAVKQRKVKSIRKRKRELRKEQKEAIKAAKKEQLKSERTTRLINVGFKALDAYETWESFKEDWG